MGQELIPVGASIAEGDAVDRWVETMKPICIKYRQETMSPTMRAALRGELVVASVMFCRDNPGYVIPRIDVMVSKTEENTCVVRAPAYTHRRWAEVLAEEAARGE